VDGSRFKQSRLKIRSMAFVMSFGPNYCMINFQRAKIFSRKPSPVLRQTPRTHLKNRILVRDRGRAEFKTGGILLYVEDLKRGTNKDIGPKDMFELGSIHDLGKTPRSMNHSSSGASASISGSRFLCRKMTSISLFLKFL